MVGASVRPRRSRPYLNTLHHDFVLDDVGTVTGHPYVMQGWRGIPKIFQVGLWQFDNVNMACSFRELFLFGVAFEGDGNDRRDPHAAHAYFVSRPGRFLLHTRTARIRCTYGSRNHSTRYGRADRTRVPESHTSYLASGRRLQRAALSSQ